MCRSRRAASRTHRGPGECRSAPSPSALRCATSSASGSRRRPRPSSLSGEHSAVSTSFVCRSASPRAVSRAAPRVSNPETLRVRPRWSYQPRHQLPRQCTPRGQGHRDERALQSHRAHRAWRRAPGSSEPQCRHRQARADLQCSYPRTTTFRKPHRTPCWLHGCPCAALWVGSRGATSSASDSDRPCPCAEGAHAGADYMALIRSRGGVGSQELEAVGSCGAERRGRGACGRDDAGARCGPYGGGRPRGLVSL